MAKRVRQIVIVADLVYEEIDGWTLDSVQENLPSFVDSVLDHPGRGEAPYWIKNATTYFTWADFRHDLRREEGPFGRRHHRGHALEGAWDQEKGEWVVWMFRLAPLPVEYFSRNNISTPSFTDPQREIAFMKARREIDRRFEAGEYPDIDGDGFEDDPLAVGDRP